MLGGLIYDSNTYCLLNTGDIWFGNGSLVVADFGARAEEEKEIVVEMGDENW